MNLLGLSAAISLALAGAAPLASAQPTGPVAPRFARIFSDHMVLQRESKVPVWGWASPGEKVAVTFGAESKGATADERGRWRVELDPMPAEAAGRELAVQSDAGRAAISDVVVGEVWILAGQSNMGRTIGMDASPGKESYELQRKVLETADDPLIRYFAPEPIFPSQPQEDFIACRRSLRWYPISPQTVGECSSLGYFFAKELQAKLGVPVGLVQLPVNGSNGFAWLQEDLARQYLPELLESAAKRNAEQMAAIGFPDRASWDAANAEWERACAEAEARGDAQRPPKPGAKENITVLNQPHGIYHGQVVPCGPFAARGLLWHQGEGGPNERYDVVLEQLAAQFRAQFGPGLAFIWGTLARGDTNTPPAIPFEKGPLYGSIQGQILAHGRIPNGGCVNFLDLGNGNVHWGAKDVAGQRMCAAALNLCYGDKTSLWQAPQAESLREEKGAIRIRFRQAGSGLQLRSGDGKNIVAAAGSDGVFHWADASVDGDELVVSCPSADHPVAVAYGWFSPSLLPLASREGTLAFPFFFRDGKAVPWTYTDHHRFTKGGR